MDESRENPEADPSVEVSHTALPPDVLRRLVEEFVTRDGTDYGAIERTLDQKVATVMLQLERGEAVIVFDTETETVDIVVRRQAV